MTLLVLTVYQWERAEFGKLRHKSCALYLHKPVQRSPCRGAALSLRGSSHSSKGGSRSEMGGPPPGRVAGSCPQLSLGGGGTG